MRRSIIIGLLPALMATLIGTTTARSDTTNLYSLGCYRCVMTNEQRIDYSDMIVGSGKKEEADENCDKNGCKRSFEEEFNLVIRKGFGQVYEVSSKEGLKTEIKVMLKDLVYSVPTTFLYHSVRGIVVARWGVNKEATDGSLYSDINNDCDNNPITLKPTYQPQDVHGTTVEELDKQGMIRTNDKLNCHAWKIDTDETWTNRKCTKVWGTGDTWMTVQKSMMYDPHDVLLVHEIEKSVSFKGKLAIEYNKIYKEVDFDSSQEQGTTIKIDDNISLEHDGWGDLIADLPQFLVTRCQPKITGKTKDDLVSSCKIKQSYALASAPEKGVVTASGLGEFQVVRLGSDDLIYDKSKYETIKLGEDGEVGGVNYITAGDELTTDVDLLSNELPVTTINNFLLSNSAEVKKTMYVRGNFKKWSKEPTTNTTESNLQNNHKPGCVLQFMSPSNNYIDTLTTNYYEADDKLKAKQWIDPENITYLNNEPKLTSLQFSNLMKVLTRAKLIGHDVEFSFKDDKGLVTNLKQVKCIVYTTSSGSYITYSFNYAGSGNTVKLSGENIQLAAPDIIVEKSGVVTDTVAIKNVLDIQKKMKFCVNEVCMFLDPEYKKNKDGGSDDPNVDPDVDPSNTEIYEFMRYMYTGIVSAIFTTLMIIVDILLIVVVIYTCAKVLKKLLYRTAWVTVYLFTFGRYKIGVYSSELNKGIAIDIQQEDLLLYPYGKELTENATIIDMSGATRLKSDINEGILQGSEMLRMADINFELLKLSPNIMINAMYESGMVYGCSMWYAPQPSGSLYITKSGIVLSNDTFVYMDSDDEWKARKFKSSPEVPLCKLRHYSFNDLDPIVFLNAMLGKDKAITLNQGESNEFSISGDSCYVYAGVDSFKLDSDDKLGAMVFCDTRCFHYPNVESCNYNKIEFSFQLPTEWSRLIRPNTMITSDVQKTILSDNNHTAVLINAMMPYKLYNGARYMDALKKEYSIQGQTDIKESCSNELDEDLSTRMTLCSFLILCLDRCVIEPVKNKNPKKVSQIQDSKVFYNARRRSTTIVKSDVYQKNKKRLTFQSSLHLTGKRNEVISRLNTLFYIESNANKETRTRIHNNFLKNMEAKGSHECYKGKCIRIRKILDTDPSNRSNRLLHDNHDRAVSLHTTGRSLTSTLSEMMDKKKYDYILQILETNDNRLYHKGNSYSASFYGPIVVNCVKSNTSNTNYGSVCVSENVVGIYYGLHEVEEAKQYEIKLPVSSKLFAGIQIESSMYQHVGLLPNDHQCAGSQMWNTDGSVSCSEDCCLVTDTNWKEFHIITPDTKWGYNLGDYVRWGDDPPTIDVQSWYVSKETSVKTTLTKRIGCKRCMFACMMECSRKVFVVSYWCFWFSWAIIIGIGLLLALISALTGITINTSYARYATKSYHMAKNVGENLSNGNIKVWTKTKHMDDYYNKYDKYNPSTTMYRERKEKEAANRKTYAIVRNDNHKSISDYS